MKNKLYLLTICLFMLALSSCFSSKLKPGSNFYTHKWVLTELDGHPVQISNTGKDAFLRFFYENSRMAGSGGCNEISSRVSINGSSLTFGEILSTRVLCIDSDFENRFLDALRQTNRFDLKGNKLYLKKNRKVLAVLTEQ